MKILRIVLVIIVILGVARLAWGLVDTGQVPNPLDDVKSIVVAFQEWIIDLGRRV